MIGLCEACHARMVLGQHIESNDIERCMPPSLLGSTHNRVTLGMLCHHHPREQHTIVRRRAWYTIIALGKHTRLDDVGLG